ncbi:calcium-binding protein [Asaia bogorensis]|uniref:beta strand repeat-containing protein n=1 Tax=Asaia bogorensis TaxID=91915 RepID=UPI000EFCC495|nr:calcium-binding protein [Asaia bogorensis]
MSIVTIVGTSGTAIQVTVGGGKAQALAQTYAQQMADAYTRNTLTTVLLSESTNQTATTSGALLEGLITTGGSFAPLGTYDFIGVGGWAGSGSQPGQTLLNDRVTIDGAGLTPTATLSVLGGSTAGLTYEAGSGDGSFLGLSGDNYFNGNTRSASWTIVTGTGNDTILATNGVNSIDAGTGRNLIQLQKGVNTVYSEGEDTVTGQEGGKTSLTLTGGNSVVTLGSNSLVSDQATSGSHITVGNDSTVQAGQGSTIIFSGNNGTISGAHNDTVSALGNLSVLNGSGQTLSVDGALQFIAGTGATNITADQATLWGADGLNAQVDVNKISLWTGNQSGSSSAEMINASSSKGSFEAWTGAGQQTVIGSEASDHFVFGTQYSGNDGMTFATVTGGSAAANTFGVLAGHTAGDITITDFAAVNGNKFFMYNYKPADAASAVQSLLATATVSGGNTSIMLDNNMKVTFMGVTDLKASSFDIS